MDVYSDWLDACDAVAKDAAGRDDSARQNTTADGRVRKDYDVEADRIIELGIVDDDEDGEGEYDDSL